MVKGLLLTFHHLSWEWRCSSSEPGAPPAPVGMALGMGDPLTAAGGVCTLPGAPLPRTQPWQQFSPTHLPWFVPFPPKLGCSLPRGPSAGAVGGLRPLPRQPKGHPVVSPAQGWGQHHDFLLLAFLVQSPFSGPGAPPAAGTSWGGDLLAGGHGWRFHQSQFLGGMRRHCPASSLTSWGSPVLSGWFNSTVLQPSGVSGGIQRGSQIHPFPVLFPEHCKDSTGMGASTTP